MGKVIHVSDSLHAALRKVCDEEGVGLKELSERVLHKYIEKGKAVPPAPVPQKKRLEAINAERRGDPSPWELPPFWKRGKRIEQDSQEDQLEEEGSATGRGAGTGKGQLFEVVEDVGGCGVVQFWSSGEGDEEAP